MKTVFFGPFVGEFGWEMLYWHAWINKVSEGTFKHHRKIIASFPGRESFYPLADEYWAHPEEYLQYFKSCNGYITDFWKQGLPKGNASVKKKVLGVLPYESWRFFDAQIDQEEVYRHADKLLMKYQDKLPADTEYFVPFRDNTFRGLKFGVTSTEKANSQTEIVQQPIPFKEQRFKVLEAPDATMQSLNKLISPDKDLIAIYPRNRINRRPDKNWDRDSYIQLIERLKSQFPTKVIGIFGAPGEAYFDDGVPEGCSDFINLPNDQRMNLQVAALKKAKIAVGSLSGAMVVARSCDVPVVTWGLRRDASRFHQENQLNIESIFHPVQYPSVGEIFELVRAVLSEEIEYGSSYEKWCPQSYLVNREGRKQLLKFKIASFFDTMGYGVNRLFD